MQKEEAGNRKVFLKELAGTAGFDIPLDRLEVILPQLDWILSEANLIDSINLAGVEPFTSMVEFLEKSTLEK
jgi:hypothetical protein